MTRLIFALLLAFAVAGCAHNPVTISGNGTCHPSQDLPPKQSMNKAPETETAPEDLWALFLRERETRAYEQGQYNSLYSQCVQPARGGTSGS